MRYILVFTALWVVSASAFGFGLSDHRRMTEQAVSELTQCFPQASQVLGLKWLIYGDLEEDLNVFRKDLTYSHYYHPGKNLHMYRYDSSVRVGMLADLLDQSKKSGSGIGVSEMVEIGHVIHHLQDMASPPHVVPVDHNLSDGFESFLFNGEISTGMSCEQLMASGSVDPKTLLDETAFETLKNVSERQTEIEITGPTGIFERRVVNGQAFWLESAQESFGIYGVLGNHFGESEFINLNWSYRVPDEYYQSVKQQQLKLGVRSTLRALVWRLASAIVPHVNSCQN